MGFDVGPLAGQRREFGETALEIASMANSPFEQFNRWMADVLAQGGLDPTAMVLSTVDSQGHPNSRVVLLKGLEDDAFLFYTNYESTKAIEIAVTPFVALNFYWRELARQVRVRGTVERVSRDTSFAYFTTRSLMSRCSAIVSPQSREIESRDVLVQAVQHLIDTHEEKEIVCPPYWGGFAVHAESIEFWQGRDHRLHDRILYTKESNIWTKKRLAS